MLDPKSRTDLEPLALQLEASGEYRVLRRFTPRDSYGEAAGESIGRGVVLDVETTGLSSQADAILELALLPFTFTRRSGRVLEVSPAVSFLEDPGRPIPPEVVALTGITDQMVAGHQIEDARVTEICTPVELVVSHNAAFDRAFVDQRFEVLRKKLWACSFRDVPWQAFGRRSLALESLLATHCGAFFNAHRATDDCRATLHLLATALPSGEQPFEYLLASARTSTVRVRAVNTPYETKDILRARGYRWDPGDIDHAKAWCVELPEIQKDAELVWLDANVYRGRGKAGIEPVDPLTRYLR
ncbi:MAG: 3'-5' exonuclease [Candidatus Eisenbacteria bacterium]